MKNPLRTPYRFRLVLLSLAVLFCISARSQQSLTQINGWNAYVHLPWDYNNTTSTYPTIIFFPGIGEVGTNASLVISNGPGAYITQGWNGNVWTGTDSAKFIVISLQTPYGYPIESEMNIRIESIKSLYRVDLNRLYLTGLSHGGWCSTTYITGDALGGPYNYAKKIAAVVNVEGVQPSDNQPYPNLFDNYANAGGRLACFEQSQDFRDMQNYVNRMNTTKPGSAIYTQTNFGGGGHCCWNQFYGGQGVTPQNFILDGVSQNIYQWLAKQTYATATNGTNTSLNQAPIVNAGIDATISLPVNTATLNGSATDADGTIVSYLWSQVSGPSPATIVAPGIAVTTATGMVQGVYQFELKATDDSGAVARDTMMVTVNPAANIVPVANAGADAVIVLPVNIATLNGSATDADGTIASYQWTKISGPASGTITDASLPITTATGLVQGTYKFELMVRDNAGAIDRDTMQVTVNSPVNMPPVVNAGADQSILLPLNATSLMGSATDADGLIASYQWSKVSGPSSGSIMNTTAAQTLVTNLVAGVYTFSLKVTDNSGAATTDTAIVTVYSSAASPAEKILKVGTGEYFTSYVTNAGNVIANAWNGSTYIPVNMGLTGIVDVDGAQYTNIVMNNAGEVSIIGIDRLTGLTYSTPVPFDAAGNAFNGNDKVYGWYKTYLTLRNGTIWYWGIDLIDQNANGAVDDTVQRPIQLQQPAGRTFTKLVVATVDTYTILALASDGTIWKYTRNSTTPVQVNLPAPARDIAAIGCAAFVAETSNDLLAWGILANYVGLGWNTVTPTSIKSQWTAAGCVFPTKEIIGNYNTLHIVDANDNLFAAGDNVMGEIGNGDEWPVWRTYMNGSAPAPFAWSWAHLERYRSVVQVPGKVKNLQANNSIAFYLYVQDMGDNWYSWGRNKSRALGNGVTLNSNTEAIYPNFRDVPAPSLVSPLTTTWSVINSFNPSTPLAPLANAGINQYISTGTTTLYGSGSSQQEGAINQYYWTKVSGPPCSITSPATMNTAVTGLSDGTYVFRLTVTNSNGATGTSDVTVVVTNSPLALNQLPVANANSDTTITLPSTVINLRGSATDVDGTIASYQWSKISGPSAGLITNASAAVTTATELSLGIYYFELKVTDNNGAIGRDTMKVTVNPAPNQAPLVNAGADVVITLPVSTANLNGSATDADGTVSSYLWTKISGPASGTITNNAAAVTTVTALTQGVYKFELRATDNLGAIGKDTMQVAVYPAPNQAPAADAGPDVTIVLPTSTAALDGTGSNDADGVIVSYQWRQLSGPSTGIIANTTLVSTSVSGLVQGTYYFELKVTDDSAAISLDTMRVIVGSIANISPVSSAGTDTTITLPSNTANLRGSGTDTDGTVVSYLWTKIYGPLAYTIANPNAPVTTVSGLTQGVYRFVLKVTDDNGATGLDTVQVRVNPAPNQPPTADAGVDQSITLPTSTVTLTGTGIDPDGSIVTYEWTKVSGAAVTINNASASTATASGLALGTYTFELKVTDNNGAIDRDTMKVTVNPAPNQAPTANAGADKTITLPTNTTSLNGSGTDVDGTIASYSWTKVSGPASGTINNSTAAVATATGLVQGVYKFELKVTDNNGAIGRDTMLVTVNPAPNQAPIANAGPDIIITLPVNSATLNGSGVDGDGTIASYQWTKISGPASGTITNPTTSVTTVTGLTQGVYKFELKATDNNAATGRDTMTLTVNLAPVANAGSDITITLPTNSAALNGSGSDVDGTISSYLWTKVSGPASGTITNATTSVTTVTGLVQGVYKFELKVTDNNGAVGRDTMQVTVNPAPNQAPTANAGSDQTITLPTNSTTLNGSGSDIDGNISSYLWTKVSGPASGTITNATTSVTTLTGLVQGIYKFELKVTDNNGAIGRDTMQVTVNPAPNQAPTANAGTDQTITLPTNSTTLNGSGSDVDGTIASYLWTKVSGPASGTITNATTSVTTVTGLVQGVYKFELKVTDNNGAVGRDTMQVTVNPAPNQAPTANAGTDQTITLPTNSTTLNGSGSDVDGTIASYLWTKVSGPASGTITNPTTSVTTITGLVQGIYKFELKVTDNNGATGRDTMQVTVNPAPNQAPTANAGADKVITLPTNIVTLTGSGSDPDGTIASYLWTKVSGPAAGTITNPANATTTVSGLVQGIYKFELKVTDNSGATGRDTMQVTVNPAPNQPPTANAGQDQTITLPVNSVNLNGSGTDPDGSISSYLWTKISGPATGTITNPNTSATTVTGMVQGVYKFELKVTDNSGTSDTDTMQVIVNAPTLAPVAHAGPDQVITLPVNSVTFNGSGTDADGTITLYQWVKVAGPTLGTVTNAVDPHTTATGLVVGTYTFVLKVTDNDGLVGRDTMYVTVNDIPNTPPVANAGDDITVVLPQSNAPLSGSGTDADGTIVSYQWRFISGPSTYVLSNATAASAFLSQLQVGEYTLELAVRDNRSAVGRDTIVVKVVNPANTGIIQKDDINIFPNPVQSNATAKISVVHEYRKVALMIYDSRGVAVYSNSLTATQSETNLSLDLSNLKPGMYVLQAEYDGQKKISKQFIKLP